MRLSLSLILLPTAGLAAAPVMAQIDNDYSFARYRADHEVHEDAGSIETNSYEILLKTTSAVRLALRGAEALCQPV